MKQCEIDYKIIRSDRRTTAIQITQDGQVLVRCPRRMSQWDVRELVEGKAGWIKKHLEKRAEQLDLPAFTEEELRRLARQAMEVIPERAAFFAPMIGVTYGRITIRNQRTRWGSCSGRGNLNFNCLLMLVPPEVRDYVIVHELCHRKEMNHSKRFWALVEGILPEYKQSRKWLREAGTALIGRVQ